MATDALTRVFERFERDGAEFMDRGNWNAWLDALPEDEFLALVAACGRKLKPEERTH